MLGGGPNYTSLLIGALIGFGLLYFFISLRAFLNRKRQVEAVDRPAALDRSSRLNVRFVLGGIQAAMMLCIVFAFLPLFFGFRGEGMTWKGFALLLTFTLMLTTVIFFALRKHDLSWSGNWVDPADPEKDEA